MSNKPVDIVSDGGIIRLTPKPPRTEEASLLDLDPEPFKTAMEKVQAQLEAQEEAYYTHRELKRIRIELNAMTRTLVKTLEAVNRNLSGVKSQRSWLSRLIFWKSL